MYDRRWALLTGLFVGALVIFVTPAGSNKPYTRRLLPETEFANACKALPGAAFKAIVGETVDARDVLLDKPLAETENLFPSISRTACVYTWKPQCQASGNRPRGASLTTVTMPTRRQALYRYTYNKILLQQDSTSANAFVNYKINQNRAYRLAIANEVLVRVLNKKVVVDLHIDLCHSSSGTKSEALVARLASQLRLPIELTTTKPPYDPSMP